MSAVLGDDISVIVIGNDLDLTIFIGQLPLCPICCGIIYLLPAEALSVKEKLRLGGICISAYVYQLTVIEVPVGHKMKHSLVCPCSLIEIIAVLFKSRSIALTVICILCGIGRRLADIIKSGPDKLSCGEFAVTVGNYRGLGSAVALARTAVFQRGHLHILIGADGMLQRKMIYPTALSPCGCFAAVDVPFRVLFVQLIIKMLRIVSAHGIKLLGALLRVFPRDII